MRKAFKDLKLGDHFRTQDGTEYEKISKTTARVINRNSCSSSSQIVEFYLYTTVIV